MTNENGYIFYREWVPCKNEVEKKEAEQYLKLWKKFFLMKNSQLDFMEDQYVWKEPFESFIGTLSIKLAMKNKPLSDKF